MWKRPHLTWCWHSRYAWAPIGCSQLGIKLYFWHNLFCCGWFWLASLSLEWRHNGYDGVSNHQPHDCSLNGSFRRRSKKTSKLRVTGLCVGNSPGTGEFLAQMASYAENVSIWWRHHPSPITCCLASRPQRDRASQIRHFPDVPQPRKRGWLIMTMSHSGHARHFAHIETHIGRWGMYE